MVNTDEEIVEDSDLNANYSPKKKSRLIGTHCYTDSDESGIPETPEKKRKQREWRQNIPLYDETDERKRAQLYDYESSSKTPEKIKQNTNSNNEEVFAYVSLTCWERESVL